MSSTSSSQNPLPISWTDDKDELRTSRFPSQKYNLGPPNMILYNKALSTYLVECKGIYFLWDEVSDGLDRIEKPTKLEDILKVLPDASNYKVPDFSMMELVALDDE